MFETQSAPCIHSGRGMLFIQDLPDLDFCFHTHGYPCISFSLTIAVTTSCPFLLLSFPFQGSLITISFFFSCPFILTFHITMTEPVYNHSKERIPSHVNQIDSLGLSNTSKIKHPCSLGRQAPLEPSTNFQDLNHLSIILFSDSS